jgi:hypothetical protein
MADAYKTLYQGQLPASVTVLATVGTGKSWIVKHITVVNTTAAALTFQLFRNGTTAAYAWTQQALSVPAYGMAEWDGTEAMADAETMAGIASAAASLTMTMTGDEVS